VIYSATRTYLVCMTTSSSGENEVAGSWVFANDPISVWGVIVPGGMV